MATKTKTGKYVYFFGGGKADGNESMKNLLGGKGANLAEMAGHPNLKLPVPPGFTVTTEVCTYYYANKRTYPKTLNAQVKESMERMEKITGKKFGDEKNPLLLLLSWSNILINVSSICPFKSIKWAPRLWLAA